MPNNFTPLRKNTHFVLTIPMLVVKQHKNRFYYKVMILLYYQMIKFIYKYNVKFFFVEMKFLTDRLVPHLMGRKEFEQI